MEQLHTGQCGLCIHFGEGHRNDSLVSISTRQASPKVFDECGHPRFASLRLKVTPISGCDGFYPAHAAIAA